MQTYRICCAFLALVVMGCTKTETTETVPNETSVDSDYSLLLQSKNEFKSVFLNASLEKLTVNPSKGISLSNHTIRHKNGTMLGLYNKTNACSEIIDLYNFDTDGLKSIPVFTNTPDCERKVISIALSTSTIYLLYKETNMGDSEMSFVQIIDLNSNNTNPIKIALESESEPLQILNAKNRVFILTENSGDNTNKLMVLDKTTNSLIHEMDLGSNVKKIINNPDGNILVSSPKYHTIIDAATLERRKTVRYAEGIEPKLEFANTINFDKNGKLYYTKKSGNESAVEYIPAIYDFSSNTTILYLYERFLSKEQMNVQFKIANTTVVSYDEGNKLLLIGYKKTGDLQKGGLLRLKLGENPRFVDNINLNGVPLEIEVE